MNSDETELLTRVKAEYERALPGSTILVDSGIAPDGWQEVIVRMIAPGYKPPKAIFVGDESYQGPEIYYAVWRYPVPCGPRFERTVVRHAEEAKKHFRAGCM